MSVTRQWFQPGEGIAREVITADIQRYLGPDALVRPGEGTGEYEGVQGYWITAYRTLTSQMVQDLRLDSQRWRAEVQQGRGSPHALDKEMSKHPNERLVAYQDSRTHQSRQYYGPSAPATAPAPAPAQNPTDYQQPQQRPPAAAYPTQPQHPSYAEPSSYTHQPVPTGYGQQQSYASYDQGQGQGRTAPTYTYPQQGQGQDGYYTSAQQPRYYQSQQPASAYQPSQQAPGPPRDQAYPATQPSTATTYYTADGRAYAANPPPQANDARRRRQN